MLTNSELDGQSSMSLKQTMSDISNNANSYSRRYSSLLNMVHNNSINKSSSALSSPSKNSKNGDAMHSPLSVSDRHNMSARDDESIYEPLDVKIIFPDGTEIIKRIDPRKPIYDLLIELSASAHLMPTNYILKLFGQNENSNGNGEITYKVIEYTPNQLIGQLNPSIIKVMPKTSTLKHQQHHLICLPLSDAEPKPTSLNTSSNNHAHDFDMSSRNQSSRSSILSNNVNTGKRPISQISASGNISQPFELTVRVQVNLPHNQKTAVRVKQDIILEDLFDVICQEVKIDKNKYSMVVPTDDSSGRTVDVSLKDSLTKLEKREVTLVFTGLPETKEPPKMLNSKSVHSMFTQNVLKSHNKLVKYMNQKNQNSENNATTGAENNLSRSKSEIDILHSNFAQVTKEMNEINNSHSKKSNGSSTMFGGFFNRKKSHEMNKSSTLMATRTRESETRDNSTESIPHSLTRTKKRQAPTAPISNVATLNGNSESKKTHEVKTKTLSEPQRHENAKKETLNRSIATSNQHLDVDEILIEKLLKNTKKKKKAPLPPPAPAAAEPSSAAQELKKDSPMHQLREEKQSDRISIDSPQSIYKEMRSANVESPKKMDSSSPISMTSSPSRSDKFSPSTSSNSKEFTASKQNDTNASKYSPKHDSPLNISSMSSAEGSIGQDNMETINSNKPNGEITNTQHSTQANGSLSRTNSFNSLRSSRDDTCNSNELSTNSSEKRQSNAQSQFDLKSQHVNSNAYLQYGKKPPEDSLDSEADFEESETSKENVTHISSSALGQMDTDSLSRKVSPKEIFVRRETENTDDYPSVAYTSEDVAGIDLKLETKMPNVFYQSEENLKIIQQAHQNIKYNPLFFKEMNVANIETRDDSHFEILGVQHNDSISSEEKFPKKTMIIQERSDHIIGQNYAADESKMFAMCYSAENSDSNFTMAQKSKNVIYEHNVVDSASQLNSQFKLKVSPTMCSEATQCSPEHSDLSKIDADSLISEDTYNEGKKHDLHLRSLASPPPHFPAIDANEINEMHPNYTVVRSGEIIEKDGTYYSSDGTIRGFPGNVKKLAGSKTLAEIFTNKPPNHSFFESQPNSLTNSSSSNYEIGQKQQELLAQPVHEKIEENVPSHAATADKTFIAIKQPIHQVKTSSLGGNNVKRSTLGNIIANEKRASGPTLTAHSHIFKTKPAQAAPPTLPKPSVEAKPVEPKKLLSNRPNSSIFKSHNAEGSNVMSQLDNELSKKLENRRQIIANHQMFSGLPETMHDESSHMRSIQENLRIDTNTMSSQSSSSSTTETVTTESSLTDSAIVFSSLGLTSSPQINPQAHKFMNDSSRYPFITSSPTEHADPGSAHPPFLHQNQMPKPSFVMSAKYKLNNSNNYLYHAQEETSHLHVKSEKIVTNNGSKNHNEVQSTQRKHLSSFTAYRDSLNLENKSTSNDADSKPESSSLIKVVPKEEFRALPPPPPQFAMPPNVAPKDFNSEAIKNLQSKNQILNARDSLMDSIKNFNFSNLKKARKIERREEPVPYSPRESDPSVHPSRHSFPGHCYGDKSSTIASYF